MHNYFNLQKTANKYLQDMFERPCHERFTYKGHEICVHEDDYGDVIKNEYYVKTPDGRYLHPNVSPYRGGRELWDWIDAGCPETN